MQFKQQIVPAWFSGNAVCKVCVSFCVEVNCSAAEYERLKVFQATGDDWNERGVTAR